MGGRPTTPGAGNGAGFFARAIAVIAASAALFFATMGIGVAFLAMVAMATALLWVPAIIVLGFGRLIGAW